MKLNELPITESYKNTCDPCQLAIRIGAVVFPPRNVVDEIVETHKRRQSRWNRPVGWGDHSRRGETVGLTNIPRDGRVVIVDNDGTAEYQFLYPDGHLGAVED